MRKQQTQWIFIMDGSKAGGYEILSSMWKRNNTIK